MSLISKFLLSCLWGHISYDHAARQANTQIRTQMIDTSRFCSRRGLGGRHKNETGIDADIIVCLK